LTYLFLDQDYKFGTSLKNALLAGTKINIITIATIGAVISAMSQGPLMQRSLTTMLSTADITVTLSVQIASDPLVSLESTLAALPRGQVPVSTPMSSLLL
jgi:hypothetical protein